MLLQLRHFRARCYLGLVLLVCSFTSGNCFEIEPPSVLLPYNLGLPISYPVRIHKARPEDCFEWKSSNPHVVNIAPIYHRTNCSTEAVLSSLASLPNAYRTYIYVSSREAEDSHSTISVTTDNIARIEISYIDDEMALGGSPQKLTVVAKNKHNRTFHSIDGLRIEWNVIHHILESFDSPEQKPEVVRLSNFGQSECPSSPLDLNLQSVLAEPAHLGSATITATLFLSAKPVHETEMTLHVTSSWLVYPSPSIYLVRHSSVNVSVGNIFLDKHEGMNKEWMLEIEDSAVLSVGKAFTQIFGHDYGASKIYFHHFQRKFKRISATAHVVKLVRTDLRISNGNFKVLEQMKSYEVFLDLYDGNDNIINPSDNLRFSLSFPSKLFHVIFTASNGTYAVVQTIAPGTGSIRYEFKGLTNEDGTIEKDYAISNSTEVTVYQTLNIFPPLTILPVVKHHDFYEVHLKVTGGSGNYAYMLSNCTAARIFERMQEKNAIQVNVYGEADIVLTVVDKKNMNMNSKAKISVQPAVDLEVYPTVVEAEVGNAIIIPAAVLGYEDDEKKIVRKVDDCSKVSLEVDVIDPFVISYQKDSSIPEFGKGCMSLQFLCKAPGHSRVNIGVHWHKDNELKMHKTTTLLACFKPLKPVQPFRVAVLALGTSLDVAFEGGPRKWPLHKEGHYTDLEASNPKILKIQLIKDPVRYNRDLTVFRVTCLALGENVLHFKIGNHPSPTIQHPASAETSIKYICAEPHSLSLKLFQKSSSKKEKMPNLVKVPFYGEKTFEIDIWMKDALGRKLANISSITIAWIVMDEKLAESENYFDFKTQENAVAGYRKIKRNFKEFKIKKATGKLQIEAEVSGYKKEALLQEEIDHYGELKTISNAIELNLVSLRDLSYDVGKEDGACENESCLS